MQPFTDPISTRYLTMEPKALVSGLGILAIVAIVFFVILVCFLFVSYCYKRICAKAGHDAGVLVWIPLLRMIPLVQAAGLPIWTFILILVPVVNFFFFFYLFWNLFERAGHPGWLALLFILPIVNICVFLYVAFSARPGSAPPATPATT